MFVSPIGESTKGEHRLPVPIVFCNLKLRKHEATRVVAMKFCELCGVPVRKRPLRLSVELLNPVDD